MSKQHICFQFPNALFTHFLPVSIKIPLIIAFLNYHECGVINLGISKNGQVVGLENIDLTQLQIKDRIKTK